MPTVSPFYVDSWDLLSRHTQDAFLGQVEVAKVYWLNTLEVTLRFVFIELPCKDTVAPPNTILRLTVDSENPT